jgi:hypothetical protein
MGLIGPEDVPELTLFDDQGQFDPLTAASPDPGHPVTGATRTATVYNVIGMLGPRSGPVHREWHRATVVVSREGLLTQREMDYWTFFAQRIGDPNRTGVGGYIGTTSFEEATRRLVDLRTEIHPLTGGDIVESLPVDFPTLGRRDWRDVIFDAPVATRYRVGERARWSGVVNAERSDIDWILVRLWRVAGTRDNAISVGGKVSSAKSFILEHEFQPQHKGVYLLEVFLFWPGAAPQFSRASISPITIE